MKTLKNECSVLLIDNDFGWSNSHNYAQGFAKRVRIQTNLTYNAENEFYLTGECPDGHSIASIEVEWSEVWKFTDGDEEDPYFIKEFSSLQEAYALAFELSCGLTYHEKIAEINYGDKSSEYDGVERVVRIYGIKVTIIIELN